MSAENQTELLSFFQVSGIHGLPNVPWDGATDGQTNLTSFEWGGYCTHESVIFPTWHRPYVMLYEVCSKPFFLLYPSHRWRSFYQQTLQKLAISIAATYTCHDKKDWEQAACDLRQPFWDWGLNSTPPDEVITLTQVTITRYDGTKVKVDNPLYHYKFHPIDPSFVVADDVAPFSKWQTTLRHPKNVDNATDNVPELKRYVCVMISLSHIAWWYSSIKHLEYGTDQP